jgi:hypothetical protein
MKNGKHPSICSKTILVKIQPLDHRSRQRVRNAMPPSAGAISLLKNPQKLRRQCSYVLFDVITFVATQVSKEADLRSFKQKGQAVPLRVMKLQSHSFSNAALDQGKWPAVCPGHFNSCVQWTEGWICSEPFGKEKNLLLLPETEPWVPGYPARRLVSSSYPSFPTFI